MTMDHFREAFHPFGTSSTPPSSPYVGQFSTSPDDEEQPTVHIHLDYDTAFNILRNGLRYETNMEPMTEETFAYNTTNLLRLLTDASKAKRESEHPTQPTSKEIEEEAKRLWNNTFLSPSTPRDWEALEERTRELFRIAAYETLTNPKN